MDIGRLKELDVNKLIELHNKAGGTRIYDMYNEEDRDYISDAVNFTHKIGNKKALWEYESTERFVVIECGKYVSYDETSIHAYIDYDLLIDTLT